MNNTGAEAAIGRRYHTCQTQRGEASVPHKPGSALSISGVPLEGERLVRVVYLDESGTSNRQHEPFLVVAGPIINADKQLVRVEEHLGHLIAKHIPKDDWPGFVFHATDLWSGTKYFADRELWPLSRRLSILDDLVSIPLLFGVPLVFGFVERALFSKAEWPEHTEKELAPVPMILATIYCCEMIEEFMRNHTDKEEVAMLVAEDRPLFKKQVKEALMVLRNPSSVRSYLGDAFNYLPLHRIRDTIHFAEKGESTHLQIADVVSFVVKKHLMNDRHAGRLYDVLAPCLLKLPQGAEPQ